MALRGLLRSYVPAARLIGSSAIIALVLMVTADLPASAAKLEHPPAAEALIYRLNLAWLLLAGFLVMFMHLGFALLETGLTRAKNAVNTMAMNFIVYPVGLIGFWLTRYGFMNSASTWAITRSD
jgi:hypothetical protein